MKRSSSKGSTLGGIRVQVLGPREAKALLLRPAAKDPRTALQMCALIQRREAVLIIARRKGTADEGLVASLLGFPDRADLVLHPGPAALSDPLLQRISRKMVELWNRLRSTLERPKAPELSRKPARSLISRIGPSSN